MEKQLFTITVFSENTVGILSLIAVVYTRRNINIESIGASRTSIPGVMKTTVTCYAHRPIMEKIVAQIEKEIYVIKAFLYTESDIIWQEVALYKVDTAHLLNEEFLEKIIRRHNARILDITGDYTVIEKSGHGDETEALFEELKQYGIRQFVRSGPVCVTKDTVEHVTDYLARRDASHTITE